MVRTSTLVLLASLFLLLPAPLGRAEEAATAKTPTPETVAVTRGPFQVALELNGSFAPRVATEVSYEPKAYGGELKVVRAAALGPVTGGQDLVVFDTEAIDEQIEARARDLRLAQLRFEKLEDETARKKESLEIQLAQAEIRHRIAVEGLDLWRRVEKPMRIEQSELGLQGSEDRIQDQIEELEQLEKMYLADDLTEETEEIVLRRARRSLERSRKGLEFTRTRHTMLLDITLPREEEDHVLAVRKQELDLEGTRVATRIALEQAKIELDKARTELDKQKKGLEELKADREALRVRAPTSGLAVPGSFQGGKWGKLQEMRKSLEPGGKVSARQVLYTIVRPGDVGVQTRVKEEDLLKLKVGQEAVVKPTVLANQSLPARVTEVLALGSGEFDVTLALQETSPQLLPGYSCQVEIRVREEKAVLTVPAACVKRSKERHQVFVLTNGDVKPREVEVGATSGGRTEILGGLEEGERVLAKPPEKS